MTALDLGAATRRLTVPSTGFTSTAFGDTTLDTTGGTQAVEAGPLGKYLMPRTFSDEELSTPGVLNPAEPWVAFVVVDGLETSSYSSIFGAPWMALSFSANHLIAECPETVYDASLTAWTPGIHVIALARQTVNAFVASDQHGMLATVAAGTGQSSYATFLSTGAGSTRMGDVWLYEGVTPSETDVLDTIDAIMALYVEPGPDVEFAAAGSWAISGAADISTDGADDFTLPEYNVPVPGGTQTPPAPPAFVLPHDGVSALRHVWKTFDAPASEDAARKGAWTPTATHNAEYGHIQIVIEGVDFTRYAGVETPLPRYQRAEPFGCVAATIELPQFTTFADLPPQCAPGANVSVLLHKLAGSTVSLWEGVVTKPTLVAEADHYALVCHGPIHVGDAQLRKPANSTAPKDVGTALADALNGVVGRRFDAVSPVATGIQTSVAGGWTPVATGFCQDILATALDASGNQWTVKCAERSPVIAKKDRTTVHYSIRSGQPGIEVALDSDSLQAWNALYGEGVNPDGGAWSNWKYPNWKPDDTPAYPNADPGDTMHVGATDVSTDSGDGVSLIEAKLGLAVDGVYSQADRVAVERFQRRAGITVDGIIGPQTWAAAFDTGANTGTLDGAFIAPLASLSEVEPNLLGPDGDILGANPGFDGSLLRVEDKIDYGQGISKATAVRDAERRLKRDSQPGWYGTVTFTEDPQEKSRYEIREGENIRIHGVHGQTLLVHIASVDVQGDEVVCAVDTNARDYPTLAAILERDRNATDAAKSAIDRLLKGKIVSDRPVYDSESPGGRLPRHAIFGGLWDVRRIPLAQYVRVVRSEFTTSSPAQPFVVAVFGKPVTAANLVSWVGNPLTADDPWDDDIPGLLQAWGDSTQPMGYWPKYFAKSQGETGAPVTGRLVDDTSWEAVSAVSPWVWVATYAADPGYVEGRLYGAVA